MSPENASRVEALLHEVSDILLAENLVRGGQWSFKGWTADGRAVTHKVQVDGYERAGPTVERERQSRESPTNPLLSERQAAELLGVKPATLQVWRSTKRYQLAYVKVGRLVRYRTSDVLAFLKSRTRAE